MNVVSQEFQANQQAWTGRKRMADVDGLGVAYVEIAGREPALMLVHGFTDTSRSFSLLAPYLAGRRLIIPDLRGHGASQAGTGHGLANFADDIAGLIRKLRLERPVLIGHSLGAMIAIEVAARYASLVGGLGLLAGTLKPGISDTHPMVTGVRALRDPISPADPFYDYWHACRPEVSKQFLAIMAEEASAMPAACWRAILDQLRCIDLNEAAHAVPEGAMILAGSCDPLFGEAHQLALVRALPKAILVQAENCGHNPHWEDPELVAKAILRVFEA